MFSLRLLAFEGIGSRQTCSGFLIYLSTSLLITGPFHLLKKLTWRKLETWHRQVKKCFNSCSNILHFQISNRKSNWKKGIYGKTDQLSRCKIKSTIVQSCKDSEFKHHLVRLRTTIHKAFLSKSPRHVRFKTDSNCTYSDSTQIIDDFRLIT